MRERVARGVTALGLLAACWTLLVVGARGIDLRPLGVSLVARTPWPTLALAVLALGAAALARRAAWWEDLRWVASGVSRRASWIAIGLAVLSIVFAVRFGAFVAGGSDSYCYVEQAERFAAGTMREPLETGFAADWPDAPLTLTPTGFVPSTSRPGAIAPICPAGLSLLMALPRALGGPPVSVFYVVPLLAGLTVLATWMVGRRIGGEWVGLASAALTASSPVFLYQAAQPMSDVPATAFWTLALAAALRGTRAGTIAAGFSSGLAILMRPNLAPLAGLLALYAAWRALRDGSVAAAVRALAWFAAALIPAVIAVGIVHYLLYGSPLRSGYGDLDALFRTSHVWPNLLRYPRWLVETHTWLPLIGLLWPPVAWAVQRTPGASRSTVEDTTRVRVADTALLWLFALGAFAAYLPYVPFESWWFLRFWLPGIPPLIVLTAAAIAWSARRLSHSARTRRLAARAPVRGAFGIATLLTGCALVGWQLGTARDRHVFGIRDLERKFVAAGEYVGRALPANAVVFTVWHSGAIRYYGRKPSLVWDSIAPGDLPLVVASLERQGREPFLLLEEWERASFQARFADLPIAALDWPPRARVARTVALWSLSDRERFLRGEPVPSDVVW